MVRMNTVAARTAPGRPPRTAALADRAWTSHQAGILMASFFVLHLLASTVSAFFGEEQTPAVLISASLLIQAITWVIASRILRYRGHSWATDFGMGVPQIKILLLSPVLYLVFMPFLMLATKAYHLVLQHVFGMEITLQNAARAIMQEDSWLKVPYILIAILAAPLVEELLFRGVLFPYLVKRTGLAGGTLLVALLFATIHFHPPSFLPLALLSAALCLAYWRTGSLWVCIGMHAVFNAVSILALSIAG